MNDMKLHCFYLKSDKVDLDKFKGLPYDPHVKDNMVLYAYTENKENAKEFMRQRNMKIFKYKVEHIDKSKYKYFFNNAICEYLDYNLFVSEAVKDGVIHSELTKVLSTNNEYDYTINEMEGYIQQTIFNNEEDISIFEFNEELESALEVLDFRELYNLVYPIESINCEMVKVNELELFVRFFSNTFTKEGTI